MHHKINTLRENKKNERAKRERSHPNINALIISIKLIECNFKHHQKRLTIYYIKYLMERRMLSWVRCTLYLHYFTYYIEKIKSFYSLFFFI